MTERKRGYKDGDSEAINEAQMLEGISWVSWKGVLENHLVGKRMTMPVDKNEELLHDWFVLRHLRKLRKISPAEYEDQKNEIFRGKDDIFGDPAMAYAIKFITSKTELIKP